MPKEFVCKVCNFKSSRSSNYKKHLSTRKHKILTNPNEKVAKNNLLQKSEILEIQSYQKNTEISSKTAIRSSTFFECICGKKYKHLSSLSYHKKTCQQVLDKEIIKEKDIMYNEIIKDNAELKKMMCDLIPRITNNTKNIKNITNVTHTNNFNINVFLNESCKDAINMTEFVENLDVGDKELEFAKNNGIMEGVSSLIVNNLNNLDVTKRPIHCTDIDRKILYVKDEDIWDKDGKKIVSKTINDVKNKHIDALKTKDKSIDSEQKVGIESMMENIDNEKEKKDEIIEKISKEVELKQSDNIIQIKI